MTIYAFGCSVTHGTDLVTVNASDENVALSYPSKVAQYLNVQCENWAFQGNSNENIFHNFMDIMPKRDKVTAVIVGWTSPMREVWKCDGRYWQFIPAWCATVKDLTKPFGYIHDPKGGWSVEDPRQCADDKSYIGILDEGYKFLTKYKWDQEEYIKKRTHYVTAIRAYCSYKNIKLIETCWWDDMDKIPLNINKIVKPGWWEAAKHPDKEDHEEIAKIILKEYNL